LIRAGTGALVRPGCNPRRVAEADELQVHAWLSRRPAPWWVLLLKGPEVSGSGASLGRARRELASSALAWAKDVLAEPAIEDADAPVDELALARQIAALAASGGLADALMPRPESVFRADDLPRAA
jgi:hypothetical protein